MNFKMVHTEVHVLDLDASLAFYKEALGLEPVREKGPEDGSWKIVFLKNDQTDDNGGGDIHLAFTVDDYDAALAHHTQMGCVVKVNERMDIYFIEDPDGFWIEIIPAKRS